MDLKRDTIPCPQSTARSRCNGSHINDVVTPKTTATLLERVAACFCVSIGSGSSLARSRLPRVFLPSLAPSQTHVEDGVLAPAVLLLRAAGPDDEPQHLSPEGICCRTCSCSFFLSKPLPTPRSRWGMVRVTCKPTSLQLVSPICRSRA